jgi:NADH-quinone oxidoreductase subunit L
VLVAGLGVAAGWLLYAPAFHLAAEHDPLEQRNPRLFTLLRTAYGVDAFYRASVGRLTELLAQGWRWLDAHLLDPLVDGVGHVVGWLGRINFIIDDTLFNDGPDAMAKTTVITGDGVRHSQTGKAQDYIGLVFAGVVILGLIFLYVVQA